VRLPAPRVPFLRPVPPVEPPINARILLAKLLQGSRSTFSWGSFLSFLPSKKASWTLKFRSLGVGQQYPPVIGTQDTRGNSTGTPRTETQSTKCAASQHEKESERSSPGSLTYPVHTRLILPSNGPKIPKGRGECSMSGKRHQRVKLSSTSVSV